MARPDPDALLRAAAAAHAGGDAPAAARGYRRVLALRPDDPNALNLLGVLALQSGDPEGALAHAARAAALRPDEAVFLATHGAALAACARPAEAVPVLRAALARRPDDAVTLRNLGQALCALGDPGAALAPLAAAARLAPDAPEPHLALAHALRELGDGAGAAAAARAAVAAARPGPAGAALAAQAGFLLAALGAGPVPARAPAGYVRALFDGYAPRFEAALEEGLGYRTPALLAEALAAAGVAPAGRLRVLDLGCGTGLSGAALAPFAARLEGLDLSPRMLAEARRGGRYAVLHEADLVDWLPGHRGAFDLVAAADVLNYLGDLGPALAGIAGALAPGGRAAVSLERGEGAPYALGAGMRYRHDPGHAEALAARAGLSVLGRHDAELRRERGEPVAGVLLVLAAG